MKNNRERNLLINSVLYFFGSLGKGVASIFIVFIGSFFISPTEMGVYDLIITTIAFLQPVIIFQLNDGIYRWLLDDNFDKNQIIKIGYRIVFRNILLFNFVIIAILFTPIMDIEHKLLVILLGNSNCLYPIFQQITRGLKNHRIFAISGILNAFILVGLTYILLQISKLGIASFYISQIIANTISIMYLILSQRLPLNFKLNISESAFKSISIPMQRYSLLLIPNSISLWLIKSLDRYCILFFLNPYFNGIYTIAHRFPDVMVMLNNMFYSAWVEQSVVEYKESDRDKYFSKIFNLYFCFFISIILIVMPITKYIILILIGKDYQEAFLYVPFLYIAVIFNALSSFIGTGYIASRKTSGIMWTSLIGVFVNTFLNLIFMPVFGLQVAGLSSVFAYIVTFIVRLKHSRQFFWVTISHKRISSLLFLTFIYAISILLDDFRLDIMMEILAIIIFLFMNKTILFYLIKRITK